MPADSIHPALTGQRVGATGPQRLGLPDLLVPRAELPAVPGAGCRDRRGVHDLGAELALEARIDVEDQAWRRVVLSDDHRREGIAAVTPRQRPLPAGGLVNAAAHPLPCARRTQDDTGRTPHPERTQDAGRCPCCRLSS
jgi:hypothetical protein